MSHAEPPEGIDYRCPSCDGPMRYAGDELRCARCDHQVLISDGVADFLVGESGSGGSNFFDIVAPVYESPIWYPWLYRVAGGPFAPSVARARDIVAGHLRLDGGRALDVACGTGLYTRRIAEEASQTYGVDRSLEMLLRARKKADRAGIKTVSFARMDVNRLHFPDGAFDGVSCCGALHLFADPGAALTEIHRVLRPDRRLSGLTIAKGPFGLDYPWTVVDRSFDVTRFDIEELDDLLRSVGFTDFAFAQYGMLLFFTADRS